MHPTYTALAKTTCHGLPSPWLTHTPPTEIPSPHQSSTNLKPLGPRRLAGLQANTSLTDGHSAAHSPNKSEMEAHPILSHTSNKLLHVRHISVLYMHIITYDTSL